MEIKERKLKGVYEIVLNPLRDDRGYFMRTFDISIFRDKGIRSDWVQENHSRSERKGIIRGLHFQLPPFCESKLVRCIRGSVLDIFVDLRKDSASFGRWDSIELSEKENNMIFIPRGFAHGFCSLSEQSEVIYKVDNYYSKDYERGIIWNDPDLDIHWPVSFPLLSEKDSNNPSFREFVKNYGSISL